MLTQLMVICEMDIFGLIVWLLFGLIIRELCLSTNSVKKIHFYLNRRYLRVNYIIIILIKIIIVVYVIKWQPLRLTTLRPA